jgi:outer membrane protein, heavy metal efflux system
MPHIVPVNLRPLLARAALLCALASCAALAAFAQNPTSLDSSYPQFQTAPKAEGPSIFGTARTIQWQPSAVPSASTRGSYEELPAVPGSDANSIQGNLPPAVQADHTQYLTLREAIDLALFHSPDAVTARAGGPVSDATRVVASSYPWNPSVQVTVDPYARDESGNSLQTRHTVALTQTLELAHQPTYRRQSADATWNQQKATIAQTELSAITIVMRAYFDALYRKGLYQLAVSTAELQTKTVGVLDRRVQAGLSTPTERLTASVAARQAERQGTAARNDYEAALSTLRAALGVSRSMPFELPDGLSSYRFRPLTDVSAPVHEHGTCTESNTDDSQKWISDRPDVIASDFGVSAAQANLDLARANAVPNLTTGPEYERDESGTVFFGLTAQMELPIWNRAAPLVRQRTAELHQQMITSHETRARAALQAENARARYSRSFRLWQDSLKRTNTGTSEIKTIQDSFEQGQATILEVLSIEDNLNQEAKNQLDILNELSQAAVEMISATAMDPELLIEAPVSAAKDPALNGSSTLPLP